MLIRLRWLTALFFAYGTNRYCRDVHVSLFPPEEDGGDTSGIRLPTNPNPRDFEADEGIGAVF